VIATTSAGHRPVSVTPVDRGEHNDEIFKEQCLQQFQQVRSKRRGHEKTREKIIYNKLTVVSLMTFILMLAGCGGGGNSGGSSSEVVSGTAAVGAPLAGQVSIKDSATPPEQRTAKIAPDGSFAVNVTGMKAPYVLQAIGSADGVDYKLHSFSDGPGTANINPLSDVIVASAAR
jgi:hypothetical protein